jgi:signal transduction histidine kinase
MLKQTRELKAGHDSALARTQAKSQFFATVSHEIRNPLHGVAGYSELIGCNLQALDATLTEAQSAVAAGRDPSASIATARHAVSESLEQVRQVLNATRLLSSVVNDVLDLTKMDAGKLDVRAD